MNQLNQKQVQAISRRRQEGGFTLLQMVIVIAIIGAVSAIALVGVTSARASQRRINSARLFASYLERARVDSVRRRADGTDIPFASVTILNANSYSVFLDFNNNGTPTARTITLESGISFNNSDIGAVIRFNWRGRTDGDRGFLIVNNNWSSDNPTDRNYVTPVAVSGFGDVTINDGVYTPTVNSNSSNFNAPTPDPTPTPIPTPTPASTPIPPATPTPSPTPTPNPTPTPTPNPTPTPTPSTTPTPSPTPVSTPTPTPTPDGGGGGTGQCQMKVYPGTSIDVKKKRSGQVAIYFENAASGIPVTASSSNTSELTVSPSSATVPPGGNVVFTITSLNNNAGFSYDAKFKSTNCGEITVKVNVTN